MSKKGINILLFIAAGLPLLAYPFLLIANIMQLAAGAGEPLTFTLAVVYLFIFFSTTYILTYLVSLIVFLVRKNKNQLLSLIPVIHLCLTALFFVLWMMADQA